MTQRSAEKSVENCARRILVLMVMMVPVFLAFFAASIALLVMASSTGGKGKSERITFRRRPPEASYVEAFALYLILFIAIGFAARGMGLASLNWNWVAWLIIPAAILWSKRRSTTSVDWRTASSVGIRDAADYANRGRHRGLSRLPAIHCNWAAVSFVLMRLQALLRVDPSLVTSTAVCSRSMRIACVFAPVLEETMFRGSSLPPSESSLVVAGKRGPGGVDLRSHPPAGMGSYPGTRRHRCRPRRAA